MDSQAYIQQFIRYPHAFLEDLDRQNQQRTDIEPNIGIHVAGLLDIILRAIQAKNVLEIGTCIGFSSITLANTMRATGGHVTSIELNPKMVAETLANLEKAGLLDFVTVIHADAVQALQTIDGSFDFILLDAEKTIYPQVFDRCVELLRPGGFLAADDALFPVMPISERYKPAIDQYNRLVFQNPNLTSTILPIGDGLTISYKIR